MLFINLCHISSKIFLDLPQYFMFKWAPRDKSRCSSCLHIGSDKLLLRYYVLESLIGDIWFLGSSEFTILFLCGVNIVRQSRTTNTQVKCYSRPQTYLLSNCPSGLRSNCHPLTLSSFLSSASYLSKLGVLKRYSWSPRISFFSPFMICFILFWQCDCVMSFSSRKH